MYFCPLPECKGAGIGSFVRKDHLRHHMNTHGLDLDAMSPFGDLQMSEPQYDIHPSLSLQKRRRVSLTRQVPEETAAETDEEKMNPDLLDAKMRRLEAEIGRLEAKIREMQDTMNIIDRVLKSSRWLE
jgi:hypothetical protein